MKEESQNPSIEPELEARIVALVLGEASDFEREELNRLIDRRPELATLKEQIQSVHGLLQDVGTGESVVEDDDWKLSAEKRSAVLAVISGEANEQPTIPFVSRSAEQQKSVKGNLFWNITKIAAVLCVAGFFGSMAIPIVTTSRRSSSNNFRQLGLAMPSDHSVASIEGVNGSEFFSDEPAAPSSTILMIDSAMPTDEERLPASGTQPIVRGYENNSKSALSDIRNSLGVDATNPSPYYLSDDVQYQRDFRAVPDIQLPPDAAEPGESEGSGSQPGVLTEEVSGPQLRRQTVDRTVKVPRVSDPASSAAAGAIRYSVDVSSERLDVAEQESAAGEPQNDASKRKTRLSIDDLADLEAKSERTLDFGTRALGSKESYPIQNFSKRQARRFEDADIRFPDSLKDALAAGKEVHLGGRVAIGKSGGGEPGGGGGGGLGGGGFGGGNAPAGESVETEKMGEVWLDVGEPVPAPSQPMVAGMSRGGGKIQPSSNDDDGQSATIGFDAVSGLPTPELDVRLHNGSFSSGLSSGALGLETANKEAENISGRENFDTKDFDTATRANSLQSPSNQPMALKEELKKKMQVAGGREYEEESARESGIAPSVDDIAIDTNRTVDKHLFYSQQIPAPVTGTAIAQPRGELRAGQAKEGSHWSFEARARKSLEKLSALNELDSKLDREDGDRSWERAEPKPNGEQVKGLETLKMHSGQKSEKWMERGKLPAVIGGAASPYGRWRAADGVGIERLSERGQRATEGNDAWFGYVPPMLVDNSESMKPARVKKAAPPAGLNEKTAADEAFSTFSLHVSDVSFKLAQSALARGEWPEAAKVRIEEFVNAFDYGDPMPCESEKVACRVEQSIHPFLQQRNVLRVSMRTAAAGRSSNTPLRLTFLLDNSGSMERIDRQQTVRRAFALLAQQLKPIDQVTLISFARQPRLLADKVGGAQSDQLVGLINNLPSEGGTNIEAALQLAFEKAREQQVANAQNRIILLTDGAVNLGDANPESLSRMITSMRDAGIAFDAAGISAEGLNDEILEALTRKGDGRYYLLDSLEAADDGFARQIAGALRPSAKNVKVQIEFNPKRVGRYKLLGFEKHRLKQEDFRNDKVDAAEMSAAEAGVAMYQFEAKPDGEGDVGSVSVRFRDLSTGQMIENYWPIPYEPDAPRVDQAAPSLRIATTAALLAAKLRGEPLGETVDLKTLSNLISGLPDRDRNAKRVGQLQLMIEQARQVSGK